MATTVTVKGQVTIPRSVRDAAGIRPGDRVEVSLDPRGGGVVVRPARPPSEDPAIAELTRIVEDLHAKGIFPSMDADELMRMTRGED